MLSNYENKLINNAIKRKKLFLALSIISVIIGLSLAALYTWRAFNQPDFREGIHFLVVVLILLNARQNLRQHNYAKVLEKFKSTQNSL